MKRSSACKRRSFRRVFGVIALGSLALVAACGWDPSRPFDREAPQVNQALGHYDAGEAGAAVELLEEYLTTGACQEGNIGTPGRVRERSNGAFDLGLALFRLGETFGQRFGDEESDAGAIDPNLKTLRGAQVDCALRIVRAIAEDMSQPVALRARARYLEGNLLFLTAAYKEAVTAYDHALELVPGMGDAGPLTTNPEASAGRPHAPDPLGRDAAWNRAIALRRIEDKKDAGQDGAPNDGGGDGGGGDDKNKNDQNKDGGGSDDKNKDAGKNDDKNKDAGKDSGGDPNNQKKDPPKDEPDAGNQPPPPSRQSQDERMLDQLENAPTVQQEAAKKHAKGRRVQGMSDK